MTDRHDAVRAANLRGIAAMLASQALFVGNDAVVKLVAADLPVTQIMALRGIVAVAGVVVLSAATGALRAWRTGLDLFVFGRSVLESLIALLFIVALVHLPLGDITAIIQATPIILTAYSAIWLRERVGLSRWVAVLLGFIGVLLVAQPGISGVSIYAGLAFLVTLLIAARDLMTRALDPAVPSLIVTLVTTVVVCAAGWAGAPLQSWRPLEADHALWLVMAAVFVTAGNHYVIQAFRGVEVSVVAPFRYAVILWAMLVGFLVWGDVPTVAAGIGTAVIVMAGLYTLRAEFGRRR